MGTDTTIYKIFVLLHILSAIVGFGGVMLNGVYGARARKLPPAEALAVTETNVFVSTKVAELFIYATAVFGFGLVGLSDKAIRFADTWVWLSIVLYALALAISLTLLQPRVRQMVELQRGIVAGPPPTAGPPPQAAQLEALGKQVGPISGVLHLAMVVVLGLMIWKPM